MTKRFGERLREIQLNVRYKGGAIQKEMDGKQMREFLEFFANTDDTTFLAAVERWRGLPQLHYQLEARK